MDWERKMQYFKIGLMLAFLGLVAYMVIGGKICTCIA